MASNLSEEQLRAVKWRFEHGETANGRPFYDDPKFAKWCEMANAAEQQSKAFQAGKRLESKMSPQAVEEMHLTFVNAEDGAIDQLDAWKRFCDMLAEARQVRGGLNAPLRDTGERATHRAAELGRVQNLQWLAQNGADMNAATGVALELSADGTASLSLTPVHVAAMYGQVEVLEFFDSLGADLNRPRPDGATALDFAEEREQKEAAAWLVKHGAKSGALQQAT